MTDRVFDLVLAFDADVRSEAQRAMALATEPGYVARLLGITPEVVALCVAASLAMARRAKATLTAGAPAWSFSNSIGVYSKFSGFGPPPPFLRVSESNPFQLLHFSPASQALLRGGSRP